MADESTKYKATKQKLKNKFLRQILHFVFGEIKFLLSDQQNKVLLHTNICLHSDSYFHHQHLVVPSPWHFVCTSVKAQSISLIAIKFYLMILVI